MTADVRDRLRQLTEAREKASIGEWVADIPRMIHANPVGRHKGGYVASVEREADAAVIVAEHNAVSWLVAALTAVLDLADEIEANGVDGDTWLTRRHVVASIRAVVAAAGDQP